MNRKRIFLIMIMMLSLLCVSCGAENTAGSQPWDASSNTRGTGSAIAAGVSESATGEKAEDKKEPGYEVEIKKYGFTLPKLDAFREELENLIYWTYATAPTKGDIFYNYLKENKVLGKNLKVKLSYVKSETSYFDELDEEGRPSYIIYSSFPELQEKELYLCRYNARGICDVYNFDAGEAISEEELQADEDEEEEYEKTDWGETTIYIDEKKAESYRPEKDTTGMRKQIEKDCMEKIKEYCGDNTDCEIYLYDFLPGDEWIEGEVLNFDTKGGFIPVGQLSVHVCYKGKKMEDYNGIYWHVKPSGTGSDSITREMALEDLEIEREKILPGHCFMAYHVKGDQITSLKQE